MGSSSLKLVSINIEGDRHLPEVLTFLKNEQPDIICLQELFLQDFTVLKRELGMGGVHTARTKKPSYNNKKGESMLHGIGLLSRYPLKNIQELYYSGNPKSIEESRESGVFLHSTLMKDGAEFTIGTMHFTWTPDGKADDKQREDLAQLLLVLQTIPEITFCGDFNAPRGGEIFSELKKKYTDNIPKIYTTSLDKNMHRAGDLQLMVDGLFTTSRYIASNVRLIDGVSDHMAITAEIKKH